VNGALKLPTGTEPAPPNGDDVSNFKLNLPTDIPWTRRCVSTDMVDPHICDTSSLYRWRSSIAIFEYEPDEENQTYDGMIITYLKVSATITGYQENPEEIGLKLRGLRSYWQDQAGIDDYLDKLQTYYPCYGAVLEVAVGPQDEEGTRIDDYPYFLDFEPKKRELYELVTDTGETMSRSLESVDLGKSSTSVRSHEVVDVDKGWAAAAGVEAKGVKVDLSGSRQGEWGARDVSQEESQNVRSTDASQESRETQSHTTQLSQMYHQLDSYHLGTNRAVFFVHPRPHTIETEHTFVNGPRNIEGIQEFVFVVIRPTKVEQFCVEAYLETGHIGKVPRTELDEIPGSELNVTWTDAFHAQPKGNDDATTVYDDADRIWDVSSHNPGYKIKSAVITVGPATIRYNYSKPTLIDVDPHITAQNDDYITVSGKVHSGFANYVAGEDRWEEITYPFRVDIVLVKKEVVNTSDDTLFITGRRLCCCPERFSKMQPGPGIVFERPVFVDKVRAEPPQFADMATDRDVPPPRPSAAGLPIALANRQGAQIREAIVRSRNDFENRHAEPVHLPQADFIVRSATNLFISRTADTTLAQYPNLPERIRRQFTRVNPNLTAHELLAMPSKMVRDLFGLSGEDATELRNTLLGLANTEYDYRKAWLTDEQLGRLFKPARKPKPRSKG
jgi:hypothetical protein